MAFDWFRRNKQSADAETEASPPAEKPAEPSTTETAEKPAAPDQEDYLAFAKAAYANLKKKEEENAAAAAVVEPKPAPVLPSLPEEPADLQVSEDASTSAAETVTVTPTVEPELPEAEISGDAEAPAEIDDPDVAIADSTDQGTTLATEAVSTSVPQASEPEPEQSEATPPTTDPPESTSVPSTLPDLEALAAQAQAAAAAPKAFFELAPAASTRLESLEAEALEESNPEPEITPTATTPTVTTPTATTTVPRDFVPDFDDGFVWSAEVLAAQGRRIEEITVEEITWLQKLRRGLGKTRLSLINELKNLVGKGPINEEAIEEIEALLLQADVGISATDRIVEALQNRMRGEVLPPDEAVNYLKQLLREVLSVGEPNFAPNQDSLNIWLMGGVNGAGKTTTLGKLAHLAKKSGYRCLVAAGDTFRAAAVEQVKVWGERAGVEVIANPGSNTDPAAVVFDAITSAQSREVELLLVDTAGRLQNKKNLMDELAKIRRIVHKKAPGAKVESLLVLDATLGQNGLRQAQVFSEAAQLSGVVLTKLDGTAKGGVALAVAQEMKLPIRFIGVGEGN